MRKILFFAIIALTSVSCGTTKNVNRTIEDEKSGKEILTGKVTRDIFEKDPYAVWYNEYYGSYEPNAEVIDDIKEFMELDEVKILVVFGSWCGDSKEQVPKFCKILDEVGFESEKVNFVAVDRSKRAKSSYLKGLTIERVPTFFIYRKNSLIGKIVETPIITLEQDLNDILYATI